MSPQKDAPKDSHAQAEDAPAKTEVVVASRQASRKKKLLIICLTAAMVVLVAGAAFYVLRHKSGVSGTTVSSKSAAPAANANRAVFCEGVGDSAIQCEDQNTKEHRKYEVPYSAGLITYITPNQGSTKFLVEAWKPNTDKTPSQIESWTVYDRTFKPVATLLGSSSDNSGSNNLQNVTWFDNNSILYFTTANASAGTIKDIYLYNIASQKQTLLMEASNGIERLMPSGDNRYIYAIQALVNRTTNSTYRKLVVINTNTKAIQEVANNVVDVDKQEIAYSPTASLFYMNLLHQAEQTGDVDIYKVNNLGSQPTLTSVQQITHAWYLGTLAYTVIVTQKGIVATPDISKPLVPPVRFYTATNQYTTSSLTTGSQSSIAMYLRDFPAFTRAKTDEPVTADFFSAPASTPQRIVAFVDGLVTARANCAPGEHPVYLLGNTDGDQQFSLTESGCGGGYGAFYALQSDGTYKLLTTAREGLTCSTRDQLGISKKVMPDTDCRQPGEGL